MLNKEAAFCSGIVGLVVVGAIAGAASVAVAQGPTPGPAADTILFSSDRGGEFQLYVMDTQGRGVRPVAATPGKTFENALTCGGRIATVVEAPGTNNHSIYTLNLDGSNLQQITSGPGDHMPTWRPDGFQIAFSSDPPDVDIHLINADGSGRVQVTNDPTGEYWPHWSPDAGLFAVHYGRRDGPSDIYTVTADGSTYSRVTNSGDAGEPRWGPGGAEIVYTRTRSGDADIWVVNVASGATRAVVAGAGYDHQPAWMPDGSRILFVRGQESDASADIWSVRPDGTDAVNLTNAPGSRELWPATACLSPQQPQPTPTAVTAPALCVCSWLRRSVPADVIADAQANPRSYYGWGMLRNPSLPAGPWNQFRSCLSLQNRAIPYHPIYNRPIWRAGCP